MHRSVSERMRGRQPVGLAFRMAQLGVRWLTALALTQDVRWTNTTFRLQDLSKIRRRGKNLYSAEYDLELKKGKHEFFFFDEACLQALKYGLDAKFNIDPDDNLVLEVKNVKFLVRGPEDMWIIREIFGQEVYHYFFDRPTVVLDVGMNIGVASLYFAKEAMVNAVYGYEPFAPNYEHAKQNFALNPDIGGKISAHQFGLSKTSRSSEAPFDPDFKGRNATEAEFVNSQGAVQRFELKDAVPVLEEILTRHTDKQIFLKMDSEGAEYAIFEAWDSANLLTKIDALVMEWHRRAGHDPDELVQRLAARGFKMFFHASDPQVGVIQAVRK
jgi:FkbM family methyltransferase